MRDARITAAEAAARLGVKRATLYAYVSRGLLESRTFDGKTSTFDPNEVERLRGRRRGARGADAAGVPVVSAITHIDGDRLAYRDHLVADLVRAGRSFESVAELLCTRRLPERDADVRWQPVPEVLAGARALQRLLPPDAPLLDRLRVTVAYASAADPLRGDLSKRGFGRAASALIPTMVDALHDVPTSPVRARIADRLWPALGAPRATARWRNALNAALVVLADHDLAASTFAARVAASTRADLYSVFSAGLGPLGGTLHGAAGTSLHAVLVDAVAHGPAAAAGRALGRQRSTTGFGHPLYPDGDPRHRLLLPLVLDAAGSSRRADAVAATIDLLRDRLELEPNIDASLAALSCLGGLRADAGEAIFAVARTAGLTAHAMAELDERPLRFRPVSRWVG